MRDYQVKPIAALARGLETLLALQRLRGATLHELHQHTGIPKATLTRILYTCHQQGLVWQRVADGAFLPSRTLLDGAEADDADRVAETASPVLAQLSETVMWPSVLSVPRRDAMEVVETNSPRAYFDDVPFDRGPPVGFRANVLRSASGRAYLAFCPAAEREAVLTRLRHRAVAGHELAHRPQRLDEILRATRARGYSIRSPDFGGDYAETRATVDDGRDSIAMPVRGHSRVLACVNLTWRRRVLSTEQAVARHLDDLRDAVAAIEQRLADLVALSTDDHNPDQPLPGE